MEYRRLACKQLVGVYITVWALNTVAKNIKDVRVATVSTGVNLGIGVLGNKGGAGVYSAEWRDDYLLKDGDWK